MFILCVFVNNNQIEFKLDGKKNFFFFRELIIIKKCQQ